VTNKQIRKLLRKILQATKDGFIEWMPDGNGYSISNIDIDFYIARYKFFEFPDSKVGDWVLWYALNINNIKMPFPFRTSQLVKKIIKNIEYNRQQVEQKNQLETIESAVKKINNVIYGFDFQELAESIKIN
jgi:Leu/Phe-tRNA-protein transferase